MIIHDGFKDGILNNPCCCVDLKSKKNGSYPCTIKEVFLKFPDLRFKLFECLKIKVFKNKFYFLGFYREDELSGAMIIERYSNYWKVITIKVAQDENENYAFLSMHDFLEETCRKKIKFILNQNKEKRIVSLLFETKNYNIFSAKKDNVILIKDIN